MGLFRLSCAVVINLCLALPLSAQDAVFSQFFNTTLYMNPALAGFDEDISITANHRSQWNSLQFPYTTTQLSVIMPYYRDKHQKPFGHMGGLGLSIFNDIAGMNNNFKTTGLNANVAYNLPFDHHYIHVLSFGLQLGMIQKTVDTSTLAWGEQYSPYVGFDATIAPGEALNFQNRAFFDVGSGLFWFYNPLPQENRTIVSMNSGLSVAHMNNPNESMLDYQPSRLPLLYKYHGGIVFKLGRNATISGNVLLALQNETIQSNIGSYLSYRFFPDGQSLLAEAIVRFGTWYRINDSMIFLSEFDTGKYKFAFSYDWNTSSLRYRNRGIGTYELHMGIRIAEHPLPKSRY